MSCKTGTKAEYPRGVLLEEWTYLRLVVTELSIKIIIQIQVFECPSDQSLTENSRSQLALEII